MAINEQGKCPISSSSGTHLGKMLWYRLANSVLHFSQRSKGVLLHTSQLSQGSGIRKEAPSEKVSCSAHMPSTMHTSANQVEVL